MTSRERQKRRLLALVCATLLLTANDRVESARKPVNPDELRIVDCLLPGQIRQLGRHASHVSRRRPVRTNVLDCQIRGGEYVAYDRADYRTALEVWLASAEAGDADAMYYVGEIYERGLGTDPDYDQAADWYARAAEAGHRQAQINLGHLYEQGHGVTQDRRRALDLYREATGLSGVIMLDSELAEIRAELSAAHEQIVGARAKASTLERELAEARGALAQAKEQSEAEATELAARVERLERNLATDRERLAGLEQTIARYDVAGPSIEIVDVTAVRSVSTPESSELIGRIEAPAGLASLTVDGRRLEVQDDGFFRMKPQSRRLTIVAEDLQGKRAELLHDLDADPASGGVARRRASRFGDYHALVIGNSAYKSLPALTTAASDAAALGELLEDRYRFDVTVLEDATTLDILSAFAELRKRLDPGDNLVIYYAGHGELDTATGLGYWLPVDAAREDRTNWISSREVSMQLELLPARHVLIIADSCYAGALTRSALARLDGAEDRDAAIRELLDRRSRTALTSGGLAPVLDTGGGGRSIFARSLLDALAQTNEPVETARLWTAVKARVMHDTRTLPQQQVPDYAPIRHAGHEGGEFFFVPVEG